MKPHRIEQLAKQAGMVQGPWADGNKERIWQENRAFQCFQWKVMCH